MSNPKFQVGQVVQALLSNGEVFSQATMVIEAEWFHNEVFDNLTTGLVELYTGWAYLIDEDESRFAESDLRRRPPPADMTFRELMNAANNPPERLV